jgi:cobalamin biosynthesis Co2+ chelatase CbiK
VEGKFGIGICSRKSSGSFVLQAQIMVFPFLASAIECEATTSTCSLDSLILGFERLKFENDYQMILNAVNNGCIYLNELEPLLFMCRSLISSNASYNLAFIQRQANKLAHSLAKVSVF